MSLILVHGSHVFSTLHGWEGCKEVRALMKALRLGREYLKQEGHPTGEHLELPANKIQPAIMRGAAPTMAMDFANIQTTKTAQRPFSPPLPVVPLVDPGAEDAAQVHRRHDRSRSQKRNNARRHKQRSQEED